MALTRVVLDADAAIPFGDHHGPSIVVVLDGALTFDSGDVQVLAGATNAASPTPSGSGPAEAGAILSISADAELSLTAGNGQPATLVVVEFGEMMDTSDLPNGVGATLLSNETIQIDASRIRLDVQRLALAQWATTDKWPTDQARILIVEAGAIAVDLEGGMAQIGRGYGGQETLVAPPETDSPAAQADPDPQAGTEEDESGGDTSQTPVPTPPVPPLSGTVAGLSMGDVAIVTGIGAVEFQGAGEEPSTLLSISLESADAD